jgi:hypothetical protein
MAPPAKQLAGPEVLPACPQARPHLSEIPLRLYQPELPGGLAQQLAHGATKLEHLALATFQRGRRGS